jgi:hypothetical protein
MIDMSFGRPAQAELGSAWAELTDELVNGGAGENAG